MSFERRATSRRSRLALSGIAVAVLLPLALSAGGAALAQDKQQEKNRRPEDVAERALLSYGGRGAIYAIQRNGIYRANVRFTTPGGVLEGRSITKFIRKQKVVEDLMSIELDMPDLKYTITFDGKEVWATQNSQPHTPSEQEIRAFRGAHDHHYESLLRYKENEAKLEYLGSNKIGTLDLDIIGLTSAQGVKTSYEVSRRTGHILYVNYEDQPAGEAGSSEKAAAVKYRLYFKDFRVIQNTVIPYEIQVYQDGRLIEERKIVEAAFNVQMEEKIFKAEGSAKPAEAKL